MIRSRRMGARRARRVKLGSVVLLSLWLALTRSEAADAPALVQKLRDGEAPVEVTGKGVSGVRPGERFDITLEAHIEAGWHIYSLNQDPDAQTPTTISLGDIGSFERVGELTESPPHPRKDPLLGDLLEHEGKALFRIPFQSPAAIAPGDYAVQVNFQYVTCDVEKCLPPATLAFTLLVRIGNAKPAGASADSAVAASPGPARPSVTQRFEDHPIVVTAMGAVGVKAGERFTIDLEGVIDAGWHIYGLKQAPDLGLPTELELLELGVFAAAGEITESPAPRSKHDPVLGGELLEHEGRVRFGVPLTAPAGIADGKHEVKVRIIYQLCDAKGCLRAQPLDFTVDVYTGAAVPGEASVNGTGSPATADKLGPIRLDGVALPAQVRAGELLKLELSGRVVEPNVQIPAITLGVTETAKQQGILGIIYASIIGALLALLTPCVYPMIPITISLFTKHAEERKAGALGLAVIFCLGIVVTFTGLGYVLSITLGESGANFFATNQIVNFILGGMFIWFAFSLFGYYSIQLPAWLTTGAANAGGAGGIFSVLLMGFVFSVTTFTCVGPIVATLLALAVTGGQGLALTGMLAFSATLALPFFFLALFPRALQGMPRSGGWLNSVKVVLGFVEIAAAFKFFSVLTIGGVHPFYRETVLGIWALLMFVTAAYLLGWFRFPSDSPVKRYSPLRLALVALFVWLGGYSAVGAGGRLINSNLEGLLLTDSYFKLDSHNLNWRVLSYETKLDYDTELQKLRGSGKPIFINFTGHT
ncbi:MAG: cytochrome c biogenesis protein CcdA [Planctomycetota bacterium]